MNIPDSIALDADGFLRLRGHRIGLQHLAMLYNEGYSPEMLLEQFPTLNLAIIHKAIAFYLENQSELDAQFAQSDAEIQQQAQSQSGPTLAELRRRLDANRPAEAL